MKRSRKFVMALATMLSVVILPAGSAMAHCDTLDGPVIGAARQALEKKDVKIVLPWVAKEKETEIAKAFDLALAVRGKGDKEKELADRYFFETLVRVHREGEGAPYSGLKAAGLDQGPAIPAADKALETGNPGPLLALINEAVHAGIHKHFVETLERKAHAGESVEAGRAYVEAYVPYMHFVERLHDDAIKPVAHGGGEGGHPAPPGAAHPQHAH
jgi:hypothetical protein